ncbi:MAG TPA: phage antirepressor N-terminal domain-containing protein [Roseiflexaceae bacterium]|nr:phage antirepressor N-terminal domain-containing protein [Roseiflexaceae bacterium]
MLCLPLDYLPGWLFGINAARVKPELKERIILYKRECYRRLWDAFKHDIARAADLASLPDTPSGAALAYELATAVQHLARQQLELEQRMRQAASWAKTTNARLTALELQVNPQQPISEAQAADLAVAVKAVGNTLDRQGGANGYQQVYGELYRRYGVTSYKNLPRARFEEVMAWLRSWHAELSVSQEPSEAQP